MTLLLGAYWLGYLWFWRYFVGFSGNACMESWQTKWDGIDWFAALVGGSLLCLLYPVIVPIRFAAKAWHYFEVSARLRGVGFEIFPKPKPIKEGLTLSEKWDT